MLRETRTLRKSKKKSKSHFSCNKEFKSNNMYFVESCKMDNQGNKFVHTFLEGWYERVTKISILLINVEKISVF